MKIIHVDNSDFFRKIVGTFLQKEGFEVESFDSAQEASLAIGGGGADMVIMGLTFADGGGTDFLDKVVDSYAGPVIVISASLTDQRKEELIDHGAKAAINKTGSWQSNLKPHLEMLKG